MSYAQNAHNTARDQGLVPPKKAETIKAETVGEYLDKMIEHSRKQTEGLCILKAKAEASGILNFPQDFIYQLSGVYISGPF